MILATASRYLSTGPIREASDAHLPEWVTPP